jgi:hypothetical protein
MSHILEYNNKNHKVILLMPVYKLLLIYFYDAKIMPGGVDKTT